MPAGRGESQLHIMEVYVELSKKTTILRCDKTLHPRNKTMAVR